MSAERLFLPEILICISAHLPASQKLLHDLCLINRAFNAVFSPLLYRHLKLRSLNIPVLEKAAKRERHICTNLSYTETLVVSQLFDIEFVTDAEPVVYRANNALQRILEATPNLEEVFLFKSQITASCFRSLSQAPKLQSLVVEFDDDIHTKIGFDPEPEGRPAFPGMVELQASVRRRMGLERVDDEFLQAQWKLHGNNFLRVPGAISSFRGLTTLELLEIWGDAEPWKDCLWQLISQSPGLQRLGLSFSKQCWEREGLDSGETKPQHLLQYVCERYAAAKLARRLQLRSIDLGLGVEWPQLGKLRMLTDPSTLQAVKMFNNFASWEDFWPDWGLLEAGTTPSLQLLTLDLYDYDIFRHWYTICNDSRNLGIRIVTAIDQGSYHWDVMSGRGIACPTKVSLPPLNMDHISTGLYPPDDAQCPLLNCLDLGFQDVLPLSDAGMHISALCQILKVCPNLESLWVRSGWILDRTDTSAQVSVVTLFAGIRKSLRYVRIADLSWRVDLDGAEVRATPLEGAAAEAACPPFFRSELPRAWVTHRGEFIKTRDI